MPLKIDLHTHSEKSPDGGVTAKQYRTIITKKILNCIAITDHNRIDFAQKIQKELGSSKIIVGEEITTIQGDIIGLFLTSLVEPNQDISNAVKSIKSQGGLVYIPHPFETVRSGINRESLARIQKHVDIMEGINGRAFFQNFGPEAISWAKKRSVPVAASSDAHRAGALGKTYTTIEKNPTVDNLVDQLSNPKLSYTRASIFDIIAPKMNRILHFIRGQK